MDFLWYIIIGIVAGWLAGRIMRGGGFGIIGDLIVGLLGALIGGWLFRVIGIVPDGSRTASLVTATIGAVVLVGLLRAFVGRKR